jgi:hypothetical protein
MARRSAPLPGSRDQGIGTRQNPGQDRTDTAEEKHDDDGGRKEIRSLRYHPGGLISGKDTALENGQGWFMRQVDKETVGRSNMQETAVLYTVIA